MLKEVLVWTALRDAEIDYGPPLIGQLIHLRETVGHTVFPLRDVVSRATPGEETAGSNKRTKWLFHRISFKDR